jgi:hypothetical protein
VVAEEQGVWATCSFAWPPWCVVRAGCEYLRHHDGRLVAAIRRGTRDEENPDSDYRRCRAGECRCRAGECRCRAPGAIPGPKAVVSCPDAALWDPLKVLLHGAVDGGEVLMVRPPS